MDKPFIINNEDKGLVTTLVREANIVLASFDKNSTEYKTKYWHYKDCIDIMRTIEKTEPQNDEDIESIFRTLTTIWNKGILSPLTLKDDEFDKSHIEGIYINNRYPDIYKKDGIIYVNNTFKPYVRHIYNHEAAIEIDFSRDKKFASETLYISKGGVITGEYITNFSIPKKIVDNHIYTIQSVLNLPVSIIQTKGINIMVVDHREPKLKVLMSFYEYQSGINKAIKELKLNIRNYKKL